MAGNSRISGGSNGWEGENPFAKGHITRMPYRIEPSRSESSISKVVTNSQKRADSIASLFKHITGKDMNENELQTSLDELMPVDRLPQKLPNEAQTFQTLKLYLIKQGKEMEAKQFSVLYSQLKKTEFLRNRDGILNLFYQLYDKRAAKVRIDEIKKKKSELPRSTTTENFDASAKAVVSLPSVSEGGNVNRTIPKLMASMSNRNMALADHYNSEFESSDRIRDSILTHNRSLGSNVTFRSTSSKAAIEKELIKDMLFIFQGINTSNIKLVETRDRKEKYQIITKKPLHPSMKLQVFNQCEIGYLYRKVRTFCDKPSTGQLRQGLKHGLEQELQEYYKLLVLIQEQMENGDVDTPMSDQFTRTGEEMTLQKLSVFVIDMKFRLEVLVAMIESVEDKKGGEICSILFRYSQYGDPLVANLTTSLLSIVAKPLYNMICQWILYGELQDHFQEFFIYADKDCKKENMWHAKFHIRESMLPSFISRRLAEKILSTGKSINFLQDICLNTKGYDGRNEIRQILEESPVECLFLEDDRILNNAIERAYKTTSEMVLNILVEESRLIDHLKAAKNYLLLGQGDFIQYLLHLLQDELSKPASKLYSHNLQAILESAIRATNAQFEDDDILARVDTRILQGSDKDTGWDVFCLDYKAVGPIGTVLTDEVITRYNRLFNALWRTKRIEGILSTLWKNQSTLYRYQEKMPEIAPVLHRSQLLISQMIHFVHQTQYYIMFEATECTWDQLLEEVCRATDLDQVIKAHAIFLENITKRSLLDDGKRELLNQLRGIFQTVHRFQNFLTKFDSRVSAELERRNQKKNAKFPETARESQKDFFKDFVSLAKGEIEALYDTTQDLVNSFLLLLNRQQDSDSVTLQCLSFRLDFNEYYGSKDSRLSVPLTYHHRRQSASSFYSPMNQSFTGLNSSFNSSLNAPVISSTHQMSPSLPIQETFEEY